MAKKSSGETLLVGVVIMIAILAGIPKELWIGLGVLVVIFFVARAFLKKSEPEVPQASVGVTMESTPPRRASGADRLTTVVSAYDTQQYAIPRPIHEAGAQARWVMPGASVNVAGLSLPGGLLYVGSDLRSSYGLIDPALINPRAQSDSAGCRHEHSPDRLLA
jgi:hypothetical protein